MKSSPAPVTHPQGRSRSGPQGKGHSGALLLKGQPRSPPTACLPCGKMVAASPELPGFQRRQVSTSEVKSPDLKSQHWEGHAEHTCKPRSLARCPLAAHLWEQRGQATGPRCTRQQDREASFSLRPGVKICPRQHPSLFRLSPESAAHLCCHHREINPSSL